MLGPCRSTGLSAAALAFAALASGLFAAPAHAAAARSVILVQQPGGGITPKGDPVYNFSADAYLAGGYDIHVGDYFRIESVIGVNSTSTTNQPFPAGGLLPPGDLWTPQIDDLAADAVWPGVNHETVDTANVSWYLTTLSPPGLPIENCPTSIDPNPAPLYLGRFTFQTYDDLSTLPADFSITFNYFVHAHDCDGNLIEEMGTVTYSMAVPEPGSMALLALGAAAPAAAAVRRRRRLAAGGREEGSGTARRSTAQSRHSGSGIRSSDSTRTSARRF